MTRTTRAFFAASLLMLVGAAALHMAVALGLGWAWGAFVHLTLFGWITGMIYAVNYHTMPVFSARDFPDTRLIWLHLALFGVGVSLAVAGTIAANTALLAGGLVLELLASIVFALNTALLFIKGKPRAHRHPVPPIPNQQLVDKIGTQGTKTAGLCLPLALVLLTGARLGWLDGEWLLAAEHLAALGWVLVMIVGVAYHVLPRFSGRGSRGPAWAAWQLRLHVAALTLMVAALGFGWSLLFALGGLLMTVALALFAWTIWPTLELRVTNYELRVTVPPAHTHANNSSLATRHSSLELEERRR
jgi:hypothetical protein